MFNLQEMINIIELEEIDLGLFKGQNYITPWKRVFGGQVLGQALNAAYRTVPEDRFAHSLHGYFILPGNVDSPIIYRVETLRDGGSFTTRRVTASQHGKVIFVMAASFQLKQEGFDHQMHMPDVEGPEHLISDIEQAEIIKDKYPDIYRAIKSREQDAMEFRPVEKLNFEGKNSENLFRNVWMKLKETKELSVQMQHQILAYASDYDLLLTAVLPHRTHENSTKFFLASLDHAMWFHRDFDLNDWLLYVINSPSASNSRGMGFGKIFDRKGRLVSTVIQEGLMRLRR
jgi:acyl-CoA thioesterase-2